MSKALALILVLAMVAHLIRPFGLPGLRTRGDFWKIAVLALLVLVVVAVIRPA